MVEIERWDNNWTVEVPLYGGFTRIADVAFLNFEYILDEYVPCLALLVFYISFCFKEGFYVYLISLRREKAWKLY